MNIAYEQHYVNKFNVIFVVEFHARSIGRTNMLETEHHHVAAKIFRNDAFCAMTLSESNLQSISNLGVTR